MRPISDQWPQRSVLDIVQRDFAAADLVAFAGKRILRALLGRFSSQSPCRTNSGAVFSEREDGGTAFVVTR